MIQILHIIDVKLTVEQATDNCWMEVQFFLA